MLERSYSWNEWEMEECSSIYRESFVLGKIEGLLGVMKKVLHKEKQYQRLLKQGKEIPKALESIHQYYMEWLESEDEVEILCFILKYPTYSKEQLAKRILKETEYWR